MPFELNRTYTREEAAEVFYSDLGLHIVQAQGGSQPTLYSCRRFVVDLIRHDDVIETKDQIPGDDLARVRKTLLDSVPINPIVKDYENQSLVVRLLSGELKNYVFKVAGYRRVRTERKEEFERKLRELYSRTIEDIKKRKEGSKKETKDRIPINLKIVADCDVALRVAVESTNHKRGGNISAGYRRAIKRLMIDAGLEQEYKEIVKRHDG